MAEIGWTSTADKGLAYLAATQLPDGAFESFSSPAGDGQFRPVHTYRTVFAPALILHALCGLPADAEAIRSKLAAWLLAQKSANWSFNYWALGAPERGRLPYPDDLDDTFCALSALERYDRTIVDATAMGHIVRLLLAAESKVGGPYRTWLVGPQAAAVWRDVDLAVNCNVAYFLRLKGEELPNLTDFITRAIRTQACISPYYPSPEPLWYFAARGYRGPEQPALAASIRRGQTAEGHWGSPLKTALAVLALCALGRAQNLAPARRYLAGSQLPDGSWPAEGFCLDPVRDGTAFVNGSAALTTALALEALHCLRPRSRHSGQPAIRERQAAQEDLLASITNTAKITCQALPSPLKSQTLQAIAAIAEGPHRREIMLLPLYFAKALQGKQQSSPQLLARLGAANLFGWVAYTIYDDFMDEGGQPHLLPVANVALRASFEGFLRAVPKSAPYRAFVTETFNAIDAANSWEAAYCRLRLDGDTLLPPAKLPAYGDRRRLAERSLGHALPAFALLAARGTIPQDAAARQLLKGLKHYLIARQLHDDLHDWEADLRGGQCSYVVAQLLADYGLPAKPVPLATLLPRLRRQFWQHTLVGVANTLRQHLKLSRAAYKKSGLLSEHNLVIGLLDALDQATSRTLAEQADANAFLKAYQLPIAKTANTETNLQ